MDKTESEGFSNEDRILTIPNAMSLFRLLLIPVIAWLYKVRHQHRAAFLALVISGVTDLLDGWVARRFNMVSNLGKLLDPIADKLTQGVLLICITTERPRMILLVLIMLIKETLMILTGMQVIKKTGHPYSAKWHGKVTTFLLDLTVILHVLWRGIPVWLSTILITMCAGFMIYSMVQYCQENRRISRTDDVSINPPVSH